ncbi:MAG: CoA transferase [Gammaproteobacteria bacterium]|nr:CoA transferase [Gammaproteobacteria bacterium]
MQGILSGMKVVEGSAFVAAPLGGTTLAQMGCGRDSLRPDRRGSLLRRWPVTADNQSLFWAGLNKGKRSIQVDIRKPEGQELLTALIGRGGDDGGMFLTNFPERGWSEMVQFEAGARCTHLRQRAGRSSRRYGRRLHGELCSRIRAGNGMRGDPEPTNWLLPAWDNITGQMAALALLAAERHRRQTGEGQLVRLALKDVARRHRRSSRQYCRGHGK